MPHFKIAKLVSHKSHFKCEMCGKIKMGKMYEYQSVSFVKGYIPKYYKQICGDCIYKTSYGSNKWKKEKKNGSLDK